MKGGVLTRAGAFQLYDQVGCIIIIARGDRTRPIEENYGIKAGGDLASEIGSPSFRTIGNASQLSQHFVLEL